MLLAPIALLSLAIFGWADLPGHELVVCSFRTGELELFAVDPATGDARNLTRSPKSVGEEYLPAPTPGDRVAFISNRDGTDNLYVMERRWVGGPATETPEARHRRRHGELDGRRPLALLRALRGRPAPDVPHPARRLRLPGRGRGDRPGRLARRRDGSPLPGRSAKATICSSSKSDGSDARQLTRSGATAGPASIRPGPPDGKRIIYGDRVGEAIELFACEPDTGAITQLTRLGGAATSPSVSHDGQWITFRLCDEVYWRSSGEASRRAYKERRADKRPVWIMRADGADPHVIEPLHFQTTIDGSRAPFLK